MNYALAAGTNRLGGLIIAQEWALDQSEQTSYVMVHRSTKMNRNASGVHHEPLC